MKNNIDYNALYHERIKQLNDNQRPVITFITNNVPLELVSAKNKALSWESYKMLYGLKEGTGHKTLPIPEDFCDICRHCSIYGVGSVEVKPSVLISSTICGQMMRASENFSDICNMFIMDIPKVQKNKGDFDYWYKEVLRLKAFLEEINKSSIENQDLLSAISIRREIGQKLKELMDVRKESKIYLSALEARHLYLAQYMLDEKEYLEVLNDAMLRIQERIETEEPLFSESVPRLMLIGPLVSEVLYDDTHTDVIQRLFSCIQSLDAAIVVEQSYLSPIFDENIGEEGDILREIAAKYINMPVTAYQATNDDTLNAIQKTAKQFNVDGVVYISTKFCDTYAYQVGMYEKVLKAIDVPLLRLELGYDDFREGQLLIRLEPFIYMLKDKQR